MQIITSLVRRRLTCSCVCVFPAARGSDFAEPPRAMAAQLCACLRRLVRAQTRAVCARSLDGGGGYGGNGKGAILNGKQ